MPVGARDTGDKRHGRCRGISVFGMFSGAIMKYDGGGLAPVDDALLSVLSCPYVPRPLSPSIPASSSTTFAATPQTAMTTMTTIAPCTPPRRPLQTSPSCAEPGMFSVLFADSSARPPILQPATANELLCIFSQFRPATLPRRHTRKDSPTLKCSHAPSFPFPLSFTSTIDLA